MKQRETTPTTPSRSEKEQSVPENTEPILPPASAEIEQPLDPKEEQRRRSRADLERQRGRLRGKRGKF